MSDAGDDGFRFVLLRVMIFYDFSLHRVNLNLP